MKASRSLLSLSILLGSAFALPNPALAGVGSEAEVTKLVEDALLKPLARREAERSRFSRVRTPPAGRRVRVLEGATDSRGRTFVRFAVDEKRAAEWVRNTTLGCAYLDGGGVFVSRGRVVKSAAQVLGKDGPRATTECTAATVSSR
jgi:hypothetical protein